MDKVYRKYREQVLAGKIQDEIGIEAFQTDHFGSGVVRKENDLNNEEKQYLLAVERGDMANVRRYLEDAPVYYSININCTDPLGRSALLVAIENENLEMIELLLSFGVEMRDALLHAINEENVEAVELLLQYQASRKKDLTGYLGGTPSDSFTPDITPIILAAHRDNYEIIKILLDRGDRIPKPHDVQCSCRECVANSSDDILRHSRSRINAYRALASPSLIALSSKDPVLTAFELSWELKRLSRIENEFKIEYEGLSVQCQDFAVDLLDQTRGSHELEIVLNHDSSGAVPHDSSPDRMKLSRLKLAIKYKQKKFVAHSNCQQLLASLWYEGLPGFRRRHIAFKVIMTSVIGMLFPLWSLIYIMVPKSSLGKLLRKPFVKFICHSSSYFTFLFLLILASQHIESIDSITLWGESKASSSLQLGEIRGAPPTIIEWMILLWVIGLIWAEIKQLWDEGAQEYIQDMWNILDFATNTLYIATITLRIVAYMNVERDVSGGVPTRYVPRKDWNAFDPNLIAEGTFAAANIFSTLKLIYIFTVNPHLGPLQISLGRMVMDIMKFMFVYFLALFSFACGINQLYWYYAAARRQECQVSENECKKNHEALSNLFEIMQTLYWGNFGLIDLEHFTLKEDHTITQLLLKLMFGTYSWIAIVVLLNMLIAMMSNSFQIISSMQDTEWKFARSKMWMSYFEEGGTLPAPFNIIPTPKTVWNILVWLKNVFCRCSKRQKRNRWQSIRKLVKKIHDREQKYQAVVRDLIKRYIMSKQRFKEDEGVTEDDINEIKTDVSSFRYELLEILRNNGMKIPEYTQNKPSSRMRRLEQKRSKTRFSLQDLDRVRQRITSSSPDLYRQGNQSSSLRMAHSNGLKKRPDLETVQEERFERSKHWSLKNNRGPPKNVRTKMVPQDSLQDEGIGESFDQQTVVSEPGCTTNGPNGYLNNSFDRMKGDDIEVVLDPIQSETITEQVVVNNNSEILLEPRTLPGFEKRRPDTPSEQRSPFTNKRLGSIKKANFSWGSSEESENEDCGNIGKQTYYYDGKPQLEGLPEEKSPSNSPKGDKKSENKTVPTTHF